MTLYLNCFKAFFTYRLFMDAFCDFRWDINAMDQLPNYMKLSLLALHNSVNEMAFNTVKEQRFHIIRYLKKAVWTGLLN